VDRGLRHLHDAGDAHARSGPGARGQLYIHTLYGEDRDAFVRQIAAFERVLLGAVR
jgi:hypothetical protein